VAWSWNPLDNSTDVREGATVAVATARHIDAAAVGPVDVIVGAWTGRDNQTCVLAGFVSTQASGPAPTPRWTWRLPGCALDLVSGDVDRLFDISDDGSTVAMGVVAAPPGGGGGAAVPQLIWLDAQTGARGGAYSPPAAAPGLMSVSLARDGARLAWVLGTSVYVVDRATGALVGGAPVNRTWQSTAIICPMGHFLAFGTAAGATVLAWNGTAFAPHTLLPGTLPDGTAWQAETLAISVNGGPTGGPDGCLISVGWSNRQDGATQAWLSVTSLLTGKLYINWRTDVSNKALQDVPSVAVHMGYTALATWGDGSGPGTPGQLRYPTVLLFHITEGSSPLFRCARTRGR